jgi:cold-inducible RNA-binding protein
MKNIFVGNLSFGTTEDTLRAAFEPYGSVDNVNIIRDRDTGQPRGFAFVEMSNDSEANNAINGLNGKDLDGRSLNVNEARPKSDRGSGGFGGGRGHSGGGGGGRRGGGGGGGNRW